MRLVHLSLQEYLKTQNHLFQQGHESIAQICLTYLMFESVRTARLSGTTETETDSETEAAMLSGTTERYFGIHQVLPDLMQVIRTTDSKDTRTRTPLWWAAAGEHEAVVRLLLTRSNIEIGSRDQDGRTPLSLATGMGHAAVVTLLLSRAEVEVDLRDHNGRTPLSWAAGGGHQAVVGLLLSRSDVKADSRDHNGRTPLL